MRELTEQEIIDSISGGINWDDPEEYARYRAQQVALGGD